MAKKVTGMVKLQLPAGKANPLPPVGPALGQHGVNIMGFCKEFNAAIQAQAKEGLIVPVLITIYSDRSFTFIVKTPPAAILIKKALGLHTEKKKGSGAHKPGKEKVGTLKKKQLEQIAKTKMSDMTAGSLEAAMNSIAGTAVVGAEDLAAKVQEGWMDFDVAIATPDMMGVVGRLGKVLGPRGLMPNPKVGTVTADVAKAVRESKAGKVEFRVEKAGIVHVPVGKASFEAKKLQDNVNAILDTIMRAKPATAKGVYLKGVSLSSMMGPGIKLDTGIITAAHK